MTTDWSAKATLSRLSPAQRVVQRLFTVDDHGACSSSTMVASVARAKLGAWWLSPEAAAATAGVEAALLAEPHAEILSGLVQDLLHFVPRGVNLDCIDVVRGRVNAQLRRRTAMRVGNAAAPPSEWREDDPSQQPSALLLTHVFAGAPLPGPLTLRTLFLSDRMFEVTPQEMVRAVFPGDAAPALSAAAVTEEGKTHNAPTTDVVLDGISLTREALSALPATQRKAIKAARRAQLLSTLQDCLSQRWPGGYLALRHFAEELCGSVVVREWTEPLAIYLMLARANGIATANLMVAYELFSEAHAFAGRHTEAAAMLRKSLDAHVAAEREGAGSLLPHPPFVWYHLGIEEDRAGNTPSALAAYINGMEALDASYAKAEACGYKLGNGYRDLRLKLPSAYLCAAPSANFDKTILERMFKEHAAYNEAILEAARHSGGHVRISFERHGSVLTATVLPGGSVFAMTNARGRWEIVEVPRGQAPPASVTTAGQRRDSSHRDRCIPAMAPRQCAACGMQRSSLKACAACSLVSYCGADPAVDRRRFVCCSTDALLTLQPQAKSARSHTGSSTRRRARQRARTALHGPLPLSFPAVAWFAALLNVASRNDRTHEC